MSTSIFAGTIFTPEAVAFLVAILIVMGIAFVVGVALFIRSAWRLATRATNSPFDIAVVLIGTLLVLIPATNSAASNLSERATRSEVERVITPVSQLPRDSLLTIREEHPWNIKDASCNVNIATFKFDTLSVDLAPLVEREADAFRAQGWTVTAFALPDNRHHLGTGFRAIDPDGVALTVEPTFGGKISYRITDHRCASRELSSGTWP